MKIAVLGGNGMLGSDLVKYLSSDFVVTSITRQNYSRHKGKKFDVFINANGNSKRFWALTNIYEDFEASTVSVYKSLFDFKFDKYIYISSVDVYSDPSSPKTTSEKSKIDTSRQNAYGFHKYLSEQIVAKHVNDWVILRPSAILGTNLRKGPLYDVVNGKPLFVSLDSKIQFISTYAISDVVKLLISKKVKKEIFNTGGIGVFDFVHAESITGKQIDISNEATKQIYEMDVRKIKRMYGALKMSSEYVDGYINQ